MTLDQELDKIIAENDGNVRRALSEMLMSRDVTRSLLDKERERVAMFLDALETTREIVGEWPPWYTIVARIDQIIRKVLKASGEIAMNTTEED